MPFVESPLTAKVAVRYRLFGNDIVNTLWAFNIAEENFDLNTLEELAANVASWVQTSVLPLLSSAISLADITATSWASPLAPSFVRVAAPGLVGGIAGECVPSSNCFTITFLTGARGRSFRGRNYVSGIPVSIADENEVSQSWGDDLVTAYEELPGNLASSSAIHVVCSQYTNGAARPEAVVVPITGYRYHDLNIDSQRRRLNGRGT